jgi:CheY-specific phosphatase CheX
MNNENGKIHQTIESVFHAANNELFGGYKMEYQSTRRLEGLQSDSISGNSIMSVLSASGEGIKILSSIKISATAAAYIYPGDGANASQETLQDLCGELNNQLVGKVKNKMLAYDCKLMLGLPTCIAGINVTSHTPQNAVIDERVYKVNGEDVIVCLYTVIHPAAEILDTPNEALTGSVSEGMLDFF